MTRQETRRPAIYNVINGMSKSGVFPAAVRVRWIFIAVLLAGAAVFVFRTIHWPLIGDPSIMHYDAFLLSHGMAPYRQLREINLPGGFLVSDIVMHTLGPGSLAWRTFDLLLMAAATGAMILIARPWDWFAGLLGGVVLAVIHGRDGIFNMGQRDFVIAVLLLVGYAALFRTTREKSPGWMLLFGLCCGIAPTIKPTFAPLGPAVLLLMLLCRKKLGIRMGPAIGYGAAGIAIPYLAMVLYLLREHALGAFITAMRVMTAYHASLARKTFWFLLTHSVAPLMPMVLLWLIASGGLRLRERMGWERWALLLGVGCGFLSYVAQGKGYPYQRYPLLAFLLLMMSIDFTAGIRMAGTRRVIAWTGISVLALLLVPISVWKASRYDWRNIGIVGSIDQSLTRLGGHSLSGQVQCLDTAAGCDNALYNLRIVQHTGFLYDEFLFGPASSPAIARTRRRFWSSLTADPPRVIVVVAGLFASSPVGFGKLRRWPKFDRYLYANYSLREQVTPSWTYTWSRPDPPRSFRIYTLKSGG